MLEVSVLTKPTDDESARVQDFALLADEMFLVVHEERDWRRLDVPSSDWPKNEDDGRIIHKETVYRVTEKGFSATEPLLKRSLRNVCENVPTIFVAVLSSLIVGWLTKVVGL